MRYRKLFRFLEKKDHIINRLSTLTPEQKQEVIAFFNKHPVYENEIDWNRKDLTYEDFKEVINKSRASKSQIKKAVKQGIEGITENIDYIDLGEHYISFIGEVHIYQPLTWKGSRVLASNKVSPEVDFITVSGEQATGAAWCISYQKTASYWEGYNQHSVFAFVFGEKVPTKKLAIQIARDYVDDPESYTCWNAQDDVLDECPYEILQIVHKLTRKMYMKLSSKKKFLEWVNRYTNPETGLVDAPEVSYEVLNDNYYDLVEDGRLTVKFGRVSGDFILEAFNGGPGGSTFLTTLEGCPEYVGGDFRCTGHEQLTSLKGCPSEIRGSFKCESLHALESLDYSPKILGRNYICFDCGIKSLKGSPEIIYGSFDCRQCTELTSLEGGPKTVYGNYYCSYCTSLKSLKGLPTYLQKGFDCRNCDSLTSLEGSPEIVDGDFSCAFSNLTSLKGSPKIVKGHFICCYSGKIKDLTGSPEKVGGNFICHHMLNLTSLKGAPREVGRDFSCHHNTKLTSLEYSPEEVGGTFDCSSCDNITSLKGSPRRIGWEFDCTKNKKIVSLEGAPDYIGGTLYASNSGIQTLEYLPKEVVGAVDVSSCKNLTTSNIPDDLEKPYRIHLSYTPLSDELGKNAIIIR